MSFLKAELRYERKYFWAFIWAIVIAADLIAVCFYLSGQRSMERYVKNDYNAELIAEFQQQSEKADLSVVLFGNSRTRHAVTVGFTADELVTLPDGRTMAVLQFAPNTALFTLFRTVSERILELQPDMIVIQDSVITNETADISIVTKLSALILNYIVGSFQDVDAYAVWHRDRHWLLPEESCVKNFVKEEMERMMHFYPDNDKRFLTEDNESYVLAKEFISRALDAGIQIGVMHVPLNLDVLGAYDEGASVPALDVRPSHDFLLPQTHGRVVWLDDAPRLPQSLYCDYAHLNAEGREIFSDWLLQEIQVAH